MDYQAEFANRLSETSEPPTPLTTADRIIEIALNFIRDTGCGYRGEIVAAADGAFDAFARAYNFKGIPDIIEPKLKDMAKAGMLLGLNELFDAVCGEESPEVQV